MDAAGTLKATKGIDVSDNSIPTPPNAPHPQPQSAEAAEGAHSSVPPVPALPPMTQSEPLTQPYPGAAPTPPQPYASPAPPQPYYTAPAPQAAPSSPYGASPYGAPAYGAPTYAAPAYAPPRPNSGLAITSLICGIGGIVLSWLWVPVLASIVAVITGHMALKQLKANPVLGGRGMAIAGLITGYIGVGILALSIVILLFTFLALGAVTLPFIFTS